MKQYAFTIQIQGILEADDKNAAGYAITGALLRMQDKNARMPALSVGLPDIWEWDGNVPPDVAEVLDKGGKYQQYSRGNLFSPPACLPAAAPLMLEALEAEETILTTRSKWLAFAREYGQGADDHPEGTKLVYAWRRAEREATRLRAAALAAARP